MNDAYITITGNLVEAPKLRRTKSGGFPVASFRVAQTPRRYDKEQGGWTDGETLFVSCTAWRGLAENVHQSLGKGQAVIVYGRFSQHEYKSGEQLRIAYELEAIAVGPDLNRGVTTFEKVVRSAPAMTVEVDEGGIPADRTAEYLDLTAEFVEDGTIPSETVGLIDPETGEIRELVGSA